MRHPLFFRFMFPLQGGLFSTHPRLVCRVQRVIDDTKRDTEDVNKTRKMQQTAAGNELAKLNHQWQELVEKNKAIEAACCELEAKLEKAAGGIAPQA